jgi:hypothetical protein
MYVNHMTPICQEMKNRKYHMLSTLLAGPKLQARNSKFPRRGLK